jgi:hypothetical protein
MRVFDDDAAFGIWSAKGLESGQDGPPNHLDESKIGARVNSKKDEILLKTQKP